MKCNKCKLVEMAVMVRNDEEVVYYCPKCKDIAKISTEEEQRINEREMQEIREQENS